MKTVLAAAAALCVVCVVATPQPLRDTFRGWKKRMDQKPSADDFSSDFQQHIPQMSIASSQLMLRSPRGQRQYDVPQIGVIMTNTSLSLLFEDLKRRFSTKYLLTYRLNQDVLEFFFGIVRSKGGLHDHPDALEFKYRLRYYILGRNEGSLSSLGNTKEDDTPNLTFIEETNLCGKYFSSVDINMEPEETSDLTSLNSIDTELSDVEYDGLENLGGYICHRLKQSDVTTPSTSTASTSSYTWVSHVSEGAYQNPLWNL